MMDVRFLADVRDDLLSAMDWFDQRRAGLGEELGNEFFAAVSRVRDQTLAFASDHTGYSLVVGTKPSWKIENSSHPFRVEWRAVRKFLKRQPQCA